MHLFLGAFCHSHHLLSFSNTSFPACWCTKPHLPDHSLFPCSRSNLSRFLSSRLLCYCKKSSACQRGSKLTASPRPLAPKDRQPIKNLDQTLIKANKKASSSQDPQNLRIHRNSLGSFQNLTEIVPTPDMPQTHKKEFLEWK